MYHRQHLDDAVIILNCEAINGMRHLAIERFSMLGAVAGDIIGSRFEGHPSPPPDFELFHPDCRFTDDTVCALAVADALLGDRDFARSLRTFVRRHMGTSKPTFSAPGHAELMQM